MTLYATTPTVFFIDHLPADIQKAPKLRISCPKDSINLGAESRRKAQGWIESNLLNITCTCESIWFFERTSFSVQILFKKKKTIFSPKREPLASS